MTALKDRFWAKVLFKEFIRHYRKLTDEQIVADIEESMDALEDLDDSGESFGAKMVRWSMERAEEPSAVASRENGKLGGRPRKNQETTADGDTREDSLNMRDGSDAGKLESGTSATTTTTPLPQIITNDQATAEARQGRRTGDDSLTRVRSLPMPSKDELYDFVRAEGLDEADARDWYEMTVVDRNGKDRDGKIIKNWKGACRKFCKSRKDGRAA